MTPALAGSGLVVTRASAGGAGVGGNLTVVSTLSSVPVRAGFACEESKATPETTKIKKTKSRVDLIGGSF